MEYIKYPIVGGYTLINIEDIDTVHGYNWFVDRDGYATAFIKNGDKFKSIRMHHLILEQVRGICIDHKNRVRLDNRKSNLRYVSWAEQCKNRGDAGVTEDTPYTDKELRLPSLRPNYLQVPLSKGVNTPKKKTGNIPEE